MKLKKAIAAAVLVCASVLAAGGCGRRQAEPVSRSDFLLNTFVTVTLYDSEDEAILDGCLELCSHYEDLLSRTKEDSEIFRCTISRGFRHQLRSHLAWAGHPIAGDVQYGGPESA